MMATHLKQKNKKTKSMKHVVSISSKISHTLSVENSFQFESSNKLKNGVAWFTNLVHHLFLGSSFLVLQNQESILQTTTATRAARMAYHRQHFRTWNTATPRLQSRYGPVLWLKLGNLNAVVVQSAASAAELFKKHDLAFADRKAPHSMTACDYINGSLALGPYNESWHILRRLTSSELMVQKRINSSVQLRQKCIDKMIQWIKEDAFEFLKWLDPQGIRRRTKKHLHQLLNLVSVFVKERMNLQKENKKSDFLDALLDYEGDGKGSIDKLSGKNIKIMILEMFFGGTETTSNTTVWAMAELLRNPDSMRKLKAEIDRVVGPSRAVEEDDLNELTYLQAVAKETMRLHPPAPLLLPRKAREDTEFMGNNIPKDTMVIVNAWAIHRDPDSWEDPFCFKPERFLNSSIDHKGQHYQMIPFGSGRRSCVGMLMGDKMVSLTLARLIQTFPLTTTCSECFAYHHIIRNINCTAISKTMIKSKGLTPTYIPFHTFMWNQCGIS